MCFYNLLLENLNKNNIPYLKYLVFFVCLGTRTDPLMNGDKRLRAIIAKQKLQIVQLQNNLSNSKASLIKANTLLHKTSSKLMDYNNIKETNNLNFLTGLQKL